MSNTSEQNGRLPKTAEQAAPPTDPRLRNLPTTSASDGQRICRDFIWGICLMGEHCKYRHELEFEAMKAALRFCHDYQNRTGCTRPDCTYLHTSREEQNLFLSTGQIPRVLAERYAATALPVGSTTPDGLLMPPPPPPPPSAHTAPPPPPANGATSTTQMGPMTMAGPMIGPMNAPMNSPISSQMPTVMTGPMTTHMSPMMPMNGTMSAPMPTNMVMGHGQMHGPMPVTNGVVAPPMPSIIAPPPPPPPPPVTTAPTRPTAPVYPAPAPQPVHQPVPTGYPQAVKHPNPVLPQLPPMFDPTRPPPPLPAGAQVQARKRPIQPEAFHEAGSCKLRKVEGSNDGFCENCLRTQLRLDFYQLELEKQEREEKYNKALYAEKTEEYENGIRLLNTLFNSDVLQVLGDNEVHAGSSSSMLNDYYSPPAPSTSSFNSEGSSVSRNLLLQLVNAFASSYALPPRTTKEHTPPLETRRPQPSQGNDMLAILDLFKTMAESRAQPQAPELNVLSRFVAEPTPGPSRYAFVEPERPARYPVSFEERAPARFQVAFAEPERRYPGYPEPESVPGPSRYNQASFPEPPPTAPSAVQPYVTHQHQAPQPAPRPYYAQAYQQPSTSASQPQQMYQNPGPSTSRSEGSSNTPQPSNGVYPQYMSRLPHQYYQPYQ